jgi:hypothetical protein
MNRLHLACVFLVLISTMTLAKSNPAPLVNQPLVPTSVAPGSKEFTLTINGTGFASTAVVNWNGSPRVTSVISRSRVQAIINAADVAKAGTASVTVTNPGKRNRTSNVVFFPIRNQSAKVAFSIDPHLTTGTSAVGDFNNDGKLDVAVGNNAGVGIFLGKGDGTFRNPIQTNLNFGPISMVAVDINNDGKLDLLVSGGPEEVVSVTVLLGDGTGKLKQVGPSYSIGTYIGGMATGDLNGDGNLDLVVTGGTDGNWQADTYLGGGDGTFSLLSSTDGRGVPVLGDFNGDGKLDLASASGMANSAVDVCQGNGDGTFQACISYDTGLYVSAVAAADLKGNGKLDLITDGVAVLLNHGDGTFFPGAAVSLGAYGGNENPIGIGDLNGDGNLDVVVFDISPNQANVAILLGRGNGQFRNPIELTGSFNFEGLALGDFNGSGELGIAGGSVLFLQSVASVSPTSLSFGNQDVGTKSRPHTDIFTNVGSSALPIEKIGITGANPKDFSQTNNCPSTLPAGQSCQIKMTFKPTRSGARSASLNVSYKGAGSPATVPLSGTGLSMMVSLTPAKLGFAIELIGTNSPPKAATLTNTGDQAVTISNISITGPFQQSNNCPSSLQAGGSCQIQVEFDPQTKGPAHGKLSVEDSATGSPQTAALSGMGMAVELSPEGVNFGDQKVGTQSPPVPITLTNKGKTSLSISQITITGKDAGDFAQTNNCGHTVPALGQCTITVTFTPTAKGNRAGKVSVSDDGGGSPQTVALGGMGT